MEQKGKIIVIDDEQGIRDLMSFELGLRGYEVKSACNGEEGLEKVRREQFDLAIMDIKMPKMDGITTLSKIKEVDPEIDVIMATGFGTIETAIESMKKGACDYIGKPFNIDEVALLIERVLEKRKLRETVALYEVSKAIFSTIQHEALLEIIINSTPKVIATDDAALILTTSGAGGHTVAASYGFHGPVDEKARAEIAVRAHAWIRENRREQMLLVNDIAKDARFAGIPGIDKIHSTLVLPLQGRERIIGFLLLNRVKISDVFSPNDVRKANLFISLVVMALENAGLYKELQAAQAKLIQSEKMAALGQLAGGAAHELNNPLTAILGNAQILLAEIPKDVTWRTDIITIEEAAHRCKRIISNLLGFARQYDFSTQKAMINMIIDKTLDLCQHQAELKKVKIVREYGKNLPLVDVNPTEMQQVFLNIILNAQQAMPNGGTLTIRTGSSRVDSVEVFFDDEGEGISGENLSKVFDPFFTTKEVGQGTGLGLSVSLGIVQKHKGTIRAESDGEGKGARFVVMLPSST